LTPRRLGTKLRSTFPRTRIVEDEEVEMADERPKTKCARETCGCAAEEGSKYCGEECADAAKNIHFEISCSCHHPDCG
jgi:hypothetical protein